MNTARLIRFFEAIVAVGGSIAFLSLAYFGFTSPAMPYSKANLYEVDRITDSARAGAIRSGDIIQMFNSKPFYGCMYFLDSPIYSAPHGVPIPVEYRRPTTNAQAVTQIVLESPTLPQAFNRSLTYIIAFSFVLTGIIILLGGTATWPSLLVGLAGLSSGLVIAAGQDISDFQAPLSLFFWWGIPVWGTVLVAAHAAWPVNQLRRPLVQWLTGLNGLASLLNLAVTLAGANWFGCYQGVGVLRVLSLTYVLNLSLPLPTVIYLIISAYRSTTNPFSRLQIRAILWAVGLGFGTPLLFSIVPAYLGLSWVAPIEITLLVSGIIPITYLFVLYRGELLFVSRYINRVVFTLLFLIFWWVMALLMVNGLSYWVPNPDPTLVAALAAIPPLLSATLVRERMGLLIDLALHGVHYDAEVVVSQIGRALAGALTEEALASIVVRQLPQALSIRYASLWLAENGNGFRLIGHSVIGKEVAFSPTIKSTALPPGETEVEVFNTALRLDVDSIPWFAIVRLRVGNRLAGVVLLGEKFRESAYSEKDARTLSTLAGWMATTIANIGYLTEQRLATERERQLMLALIENEEHVLAEVAGELHDRGISALGMVRLMVEQKRDSAILFAALERVITDLRELSNQRLSPAGLSQGLPQALEAMVVSHQQLGLPVSLYVDESYATAGSLSRLAERELFYIAQEAAVNAVKHARANRITVCLSGSNDQVRLTISDDGQGFDSETTLKGSPTRGTGIMHARASRIGGTFSTSSKIGYGTEVVVEVGVVASERRN